jgi:membrane fusion protein (multidrug efflux system)
MQKTSVSKVRLDRGEQREADSAVPLTVATGADTPAADKQRLRRILFAAGPIAVLGLIAFLYFSSGRYVETDNAYIKANKVTISAEIAGPISVVAVHENQQVQAGQELFRIDEQPFRIALERAEAQLRTVRSDIDGLKAAYRQKVEQLRLAKTNVAFAERELARQSQLAQRKLISQVKLDEAQHSLDNAREQVAVLEQEEAQTLTQLTGNATIAAEKHPRYQQAKADRDTAALNLQRTAVRAPFAGITSKVPQVGQYISAGSAVMSVIATDKLWIEANFMETDLANVRAGQPVTIHIDTYSSRTWQGTVQSIAQATGAEFSVLPPQNASGNWVKVVQRIPVRIAISATPEDPPLRVGMTAAVEIDTGAHHTVSALLGRAGH